MPDLLPEVTMAREPDRILVRFDNQANSVDPALLASQAVNLAVDMMPKVTGYMATTLRPIHGDGYLGIYFPDRRVWFLEQGTRPFTMRSLAGRTIPMWIDDPTGAERAANPKAKTRKTDDGRTQILIFRKAATAGSRRSVVRRGPGGSSRAVTVPASYPGAPGRIRRREAPKPATTAGRTGGRVASGNVGVRWRHPGTMGRKFLNVALAMTSWNAGLQPDAAYLVDAISFNHLVGS